MSASATSLANAPSHGRSAPAGVSPITAHPLLAVMGVLLGALTSVFTGRLLGIGLPDVQGAIGASSDAMSWVSTAFNAGNMFIGPLIVFVGALFGVRRVLLWASAVFMLAEFLSPIVAHNIGALTILQAIAGLAAGTYYPLTMTAIIRNLPLKYVYLGVGAYALDILASTHIATALEAWYITHLSWQWIFWNALLTTPLLMACIYWAIPRQPLPPRTTHFRVWGFLYASVGLTLVYCGLDQGERLDWFHCGIINACFITGALLLAVAIYSRWKHPNPMLNLRFLTTRNFLLLGAVLVIFRFLLLSPTLLVPQFLEVLHGYRPDQTGQVLGWISLVELAVAPVAAFLLYKVDSRLLCAVGFILAGGACLACARVDPSWIGETFVPMQVVFAVGVAFALTGLIATILQTALMLGALQNPANTLTISCWFQTCRLFGAEGGKALMVRFLTMQSVLHYSVLAQHLDGGFKFDERVRQLIGGLLPGGSGVDEARLRAALEIASSLKQQIVLLSLSDGFILIGTSAAICLLILGFLKRTPSLAEQKR